jgi:exonuclease SbcC
MYLISVRLQNFRQHKDTYIQFNQGLTGILGQNGAGKSTVLEGIAWAFYGNKDGVLRGKKDSLIWRYAPGRSKVIVDLEFRFENSNYRIQRSQGNISTAQLWQNDNLIANSVKAVEEKLTQLLRMEHKEFFNSYFTGQKELQFLSSIEGGANKERFIARMLGYERIEEAQGKSEKADTIRYDLKQKEIQKNQLEGYLDSFVGLDDRILEQTKKIEKVKSELQSIQQKFIEVSEMKDKIEPQWEELREKRTQSLQLQNQLKTHLSNLQKITTDINNLTKRQSELSQEMDVYLELQQAVTDYPSLQAEYKTLSNNYQSFLRSQAMREQSEKLKKDIESLKQDLVDFSSIQTQLDDLIQMITECQNKITDRDQEIRTKTIEWQQNLAEHQANSKVEQQTLNKLEKQLKTIIEAGEEGVCPTCERPLQSEYSNVVDNFTRQKEKCQEQLTFSQVQVKLLTAKPNVIFELEQARVVLQKELETLKKRKDELSQQKVKMELLEQQLLSKEKELANLQKQLLDSEQVFDLPYYQNVQNRIEQLKPKYEGFLKLAQTPKNLELITENLTQKQLDQENLNQLVTELQEQIASLNYQEADFISLQKQLEATRKSYEDIKEAYRSSQQSLVFEEQNLQTLNNQKQEYLAKEKERKLVTQEYLTLKELDKAFSALRQYLTEKIRPQLADSASYFLQQLTDGRYTNLRIDEKYQIIVQDQEEDRPVISGGEEDIVNLSLRLAVSQMITERTGQPFSLLILDEVFGSLDQSRRDNVINLLYRLEAQFEQVLIITHLEDIKDSLSQSIRLAYDPIKQHTIMLDE